MRKINGVAMRALPFFSQLLFVCLLAGCCFSRCLAQPSNSSDYTNGLPGPVNLPSATLGILDRSIMSYSVPEVSFNARSLTTPGLRPFASTLTPFDFLTVPRSQFENTLRLPGFLYDLSKAISRMPPEAVLYIGTQSRLGSGSPIYAPEIYYSSLTGSFDASLQGFFTEQGGRRTDGFGAALRFDLSPGDQKLLRHIIALKRLRALTERAWEAFLAESSSPSFNATGFVNDLRSAFQRVLGVNSAAELDTALRSIQIVDDFVGAARSTRIAVFGGYRSFGGLETDANLGVSISKLLALHGETGSGLTPQLTLQGAEVSPNDQAGVHFERRTGIRFGMALLWQDRIPHLITRKEKQRGEVDAVARWRWQTGVEYQFKSSIDNGSNLSFFARHRDLGANIDYTALAGIGAHGRAYIGINIGKSFDITSHSKSKVLPDSAP